MSSEGRLTDERDWDAYWLRRRSDPQLEITHGTSLQVSAILDVFDRFLEPNSGISALEAGGAPGKYLVYIHRLTSCRCAVIDNSPVGCEQTRENFERLGIPVEVFEHDLLDPHLDIGRFDLVYSLGLIEHFEDVQAVVAAHVRLVRPGGLLVLGVPNLRGVNGWFAERIDRRRFESHNVDAMATATWDSFERGLHLRRLFRGHVGGFEPAVFTVRHNADSPRARLPVRALAALLLRVFGNRLPGLRRVNSPLFSGYVMGVWRVPGEAGA